jgi:hypothetical protein
MKIYLINKALEDTRTGDGVGGYVMTGDVFRRFFILIAMEIGSIHVESCWKELTVKRK